MFMFRTGIVIKHFEHLNIPGWIQALNGLLLVPPAGRVLIFTGFAPAGHGALHVTGDDVSESLPHLGVLCCGYSCGSWKGKKKSCSYSNYIFTALNVFFSLCLKHKLLSRQKCGPVLMKNASRHFIFASVFVCFLPPIHPSSEPAASLFLESWGCCSSLSCCWVKVGRLHPAISCRATLTKTYQACFWTVRENPHIHEDNMQTPLAVISYLDFIFKTHLKHQWYIKKKDKRALSTRIGLYSRASAYFIHQSLFRSLKVKANPKYFLFQDVILTVIVYFMEIKWQLKKKTAFFSPNVSFFCFCFGLISSVQRTSAAWGTMLK